MKIVMVSHYFESHRGGVEIVAGQLARAFTALGHDCVWIASDCSPPPADRAAGWRAVPLRANNALERHTGIPYPIPLRDALARLSAEMREADVVVVHDAFYVLCSLAQRAARRAGKPVLIVQHIGFVPYRNPLFRMAMRLLNRALAEPALADAAQVVFISELTARHYAAVRFRRRPMIVFNGVDATVFHPSPPGADRSALRASIGLDAARPVILFVGRFVEKKGLHHIEQLARRRPHWNWVLAGWGPIDPQRWRLPNVRVFSDRSGARLAPLYQAADALVLPSVGEGFPLVVQEALACGLPVVCGQDTATADPDAAPWLVGVPVHPNDPSRTADAFARALDAMMSSRGAGEAERLARANFAYGRYSWSGAAAQLIAVLEAMKDAETG